MSNEHITDEREAFVSWSQREYRHATIYTNRDFEIGLAAWEARATLRPTPQPAEQWETSPMGGEQWGTSPKGGEQWKTVPFAQPVGEPVASIPNDGPSTYEQRFTDAVRVICGVTPPAELVRDWIGKTERRDDLQQWVGSYAPGWVQNIAVLDAAHVMATQPTEGGTHRTE